MTFRFITIVDKNLKLVLDYCQWNEEKFNTDQLTGINFSQTNDGNYVLGLVFQDDTAWQTALDEGNLYKFQVCRDVEEDWMSYKTISKWLMLGNFSHIMARRFE